MLSMPFLVFPFFSITISPIFPFSSHLVETGIQNVEIGEEFILFSSNDTKK
jgi:hypothetical protein